MEVSLVLSLKLPPGTATLPKELAATAAAGGVSIKLGCGRTKVRALPGAPPGQVGLSADAWRVLAVPYQGIRLKVKKPKPGRLEFGPAVSVLYPGRGRRIKPEWIEERTDQYFGHLRGAPGLLALGFDRSINWKDGTVGGFVLDNRPGQSNRTIAARFPIPDAVYLSWITRPDVVQRLRHATRERAFNWPRRFSKWVFYAMMSALPVIRDHLPDTRRFHRAGDLEAMLACYETVWVKKVRGFRGRGVVRVRRQPGGFELRFMKEKRPVRSLVANPGELDRRLRVVLGRGPHIVQQGICTVGLKGKTLDFRVVVVKDGAGEWRCLKAHAKVAQNRNLVVTSEAPYVGVVRALRRHIGLSRAAANKTALEMVDLSLKTARALDPRFFPLGILGMDLAVDAGDKKIWIIEANPVPAWDYSLEVKKKLGRSLVDYALYLAGG